MSAHSFDVNDPQTWAIPPEATCTFDEFNERYPMGDAEISAVARIFDQIDTRRARAAQARVDGGADDG